MDQTKARSRKTRWQSFKQCITDSPFRKAVLLELGPLNVWRFFNFNTDTSRPRYSSEYCKIFTQLNPKTAARIMKKWCKEGHEEKAISALEELELKERTAICSAWIELVIPNNVGFRESCEELCKGSKCNELADVLLKSDRLYTSLVPCDSLVAALLINRMSFEQLIKTQMRILVDEHKNFGDYFGLWMVSAYSIYAIQAAIKKKVREADEQELSNITNILTPALLKWLVVHVDKETAFRIVDCVNEYEALCGVFSLYWKKEEAIREYLAEQILRLAKKDPQKVADELGGECVMQVVEILGYERSIKSPEVLDAVALALEKDVSKYKSTGPIISFSDARTLGEVSIRFKQPQLLSHICTEPAILAATLADAKDEKIQNALIDNLAGVFVHYASKVLLEKKENFEYGFPWVSETRADASVLVVLETFRRDILKGHLGQDEINEIVKRSRLSDVLLTYCGLADHAKSIEVLSLKVADGKYVEEYVNDYTGATGGGYNEQIHIGTFLMQPESRWGKRENAARLVRELGEFAIPGLIRALYSEDETLAELYVPPKNQYEIGTKNLIVESVGTPHLPAIRLKPVYEIKKRTGRAIALLEGLLPAITDGALRKEAIDALVHAKGREYNLDPQPQIESFKYVHSY